MFEGRGTGICGGIAIVLRFEFRDAVFEVADVVDGGLGSNLVKTVFDGELVNEDENRGCFTCNIANLCISPVHAGIISFRTPNSSFIFDLLLRSIKLCAVFLAIFLPATLVDDGCLFFDAGVEVFPTGLFETSLIDSASTSSCWALGFIWMIFLDLVGGGGSAKASLLGA